MNANFTPIQRDEMWKNAVRSEERMWTSWASAQERRLMSLAEETCRKRVRHRTVNVFLDFCHFS